MKKSKNKDTKSIGSLKELASYRSFFAEETPLRDIADIFEDDLESTASENISMISESLNEPTYTIKILNNTKSIRNKQFKFSNYIENNNKNTTTNSDILKILNLMNEEHLIDDLPMVEDNEIDFNPRLESIIQNLGVDTSLPTFKWKVSDALFNDLAFNKSGDLLRIITQTIGSELIIVLFDPFHLFATNNFNYTFEKVKTYPVCLSQLFNHISKP